tara:strand:- start:915 stop:1919 length:1005 start_codon:yes stop_codon:yes gene_type:complete
VILKIRPYGIGDYKLMEKILVTGSCGFIGMHLCKYLLKNDYEVLGIDNMNDYYDPLLKMNRLEQISAHDNFSFIELNISNYDQLSNVFSNYKPDKVVNLAAQAGVRYSLENPHAYVETNISGFMNILECCRYNKVKGLIYASSSSVYGGNKQNSFSIEDRVDKPISIYAASKKANELMAHTYNHLYGLNTTGLRFFTVYGPWGRPDMAMYIFTEKIMRGQKIPVFNHGKMERDFTYIDDIIQGIVKSLEKNYENEIFNLGNNRCENLMDMINHIEESIGEKAIIDFMDIQPGDVKKTFADIEYSKKMLNYSPKTPIAVGIPLFIEWYKSYITKT